MQNSSPCKGYIASSATQRGQTLHHSHIDLGEALLCTPAVSLMCAFSLMHSPQTAYCMLGQGSIHHRFCETHTVLMPAL